MSAPGVVAAASAGAGAGQDTAAVLAALRSADVRRARWVATTLTAGLVLVVGAGLMLGDVHLTPAEVVRALLGAEGPSHVVVLGLRLPRLAMGAAVGAALGLSGALLQSVVRNPLASPDIVGVTGGASAAAVLAIAAGATGAAVDSAALAGALGAAALVIGLSGRGVVGTRFVVVGVAVAFAANGVLGYGLTRANLTAARSAYVWLVGGVGTASWGQIARVAAVVAVAALVLAAAQRPLAALRLDDDTALALGARPATVRTGAVVVSALLAATAVAAAGPVAFVAFVSGPLARRLRGHGPALATAAAVGALVVTVADLVAQHLLGSLQPPAGLITGALGAPVLLWVLVRRR